MTATVLSVDSTSDSAIKTALETLGVAGNLVIVIPTGTGSIVKLAKHV